MDSIPNLQPINSQVPSSMSSLSCPSEPPDIGNWFSSYEYQSPGLDSNFTLEESGSRCSETQLDEEHEVDLDKVRVQDEEVDREKVVPCIGISVKDGNHNEDSCLNKNLHPCSSCSPFSEPPDIRNWFSSYVDDSSAFDTSTLLSDEEVSEGNKCGGERFNFEVINKDESRSENVHPKVCVEHNSSFEKNMEGDGIAGVKKNLTIANTSHLEKNLQPCLQDKVLQPSLGSTKHKETMNRNHGSPGCIGEAHSMPLNNPTGAMRPPKLVENHDTEEAKSKAEIQAEKPDISTSLAKSFSARSSTSTSNKENDGFVSTRKNRDNRANDENSWKKPEKTLLQCSTSTGTVPLASEKNSGAKRKALTEATNLQQSNVIEITGKWQCPQKHKPYKGPALKQLRLERWVRRV